MKETCAPGAMTRAEAFTGVGAGGALVRRVRGVCAVWGRARACVHQPSPRTSTIIFYVAWASRVSIERSISKRTLPYQRQRSTQPRFSVRLREPRDGANHIVRPGLPPASIKANNAREKVKGRLSMGTRSGGG